MSSAFISESASIPRLVLGLIAEPAPDLFLSEFYFLPSIKSVKKVSPVASLPVGAIPPSIFASASAAIWALDLKIALPD